MPEPVGQERGRRQGVGGVCSPGTGPARLGTEGRPRLAPSGIRGPELPPDWLGRGHFQMLLFLDFIIFHWLLEAFPTSRFL